MEDDNKLYSTNPCLEISLGDSMTWDGCTIVSDWYIIQNRDDVINELLEEDGG